MNDNRPWRHASRQDRSRATAGRILDAFAAELDRHPLAEVAMTAVARRARVSVGGMYARFPGKEALLHALDERLVAELLVAARARLDPARLAGKNLGDVLGCYVALAAEMFVRHRTVLREVAIHSRTTDDARYVARVREFNQELHGRLHDLAMARAAEIVHPDPAAAIDLGLLFISAALREQLLFGARRLNRSRVGRDRLIRELTRAWLAYLTTKP